MNVIDRFFTWVCERFHRKYHVQESTYRRCRKCRRCWRDG